MASSDLRGEAYAASERTTPSVDKAARSDVARPMRRKDLEPMFSIEAVLVLCVLFAVAACMFASVRILRE